MNLRSSAEWRERLASPLTWHYVGAVVLLVVTAVLAVRFGLDFAATSTSSSDALASKQMELTALNMAAVPLRGLDKRVAESREQIGDFYRKRIPANYSSISARLGELQVKAGVRLTRVQYSQGPPGPELTEISMDAGISGEYPQIMRFVNSLERDETFFVIRAMSLTGQQGGMVNLRLKVSTWMRPADAAAAAGPQSSEPQKSESGSAQPGAASPAPTTKAKEGE